MAVHFIYGRAGYGKTEYVADGICKRLANGGRTYLVVPEQYTHIAEHKLLKRVGSISPETVEVTSFNKMISRMESSNGITDILSPMAKNIIMADILSYTELNYFSGTATLSGFSDICLKLIGELKKYCISPELLAEAGKAEGINPRLKMKMDDIVKVYAEYVRRIDIMGFNSDDGATLLAEKIASEEDWSDTVFYFDEFTSFIPQELEIIRQIALKAEEVYITLCTDGEDHVLFAPITDTTDKIKRMCVKSGIEVAAPVVLRENKKHSRELFFLEKNMFPYPRAVYDDDCTDISLLSAASPYEEIEQTARRIMGLCCYGRYRYKDIAVICSDMATYAPFVKPVFNRYGIPYFIDEKSPAVNHPIVTFVLNIIDIYVNDYRNDDVFAFLKSGLCDGDMDSIYLLENFCRSTNMQKSTWTNEDKWTTLISKSDLSDADAMRICRVRDDVIKPLMAFHNSIKGRHKVSHICRCLYEYLVSIGLVSHIEERLRLFEAEQDVIHGEEYEKIWNIIIDALDALTDVSGDKTVNVGNFRLLLQTALSGYSTGFIPTSLDGVSIGNITRSKMDDVKVLFVLGANDGVFPAPPVTGELINDDDKLILAENGIELSADGKTRAFFERFFIYSVFTLPSELLYISFSRSDSSARALRPSFVLSDLRRMFSGLKVESDIVESDDDFGQMEYVNSVAPTLEKMIEKITEYKNGGNISNVWFDVYDYFCRNFDFGTKLKEYYSYTNEAGYIDRELMSQFVPDEFYTTISRLQRYRSCRFSYFLEYILRLKNKGEFDITAMDTGSFVHGVIERLCRDMGGDGYTFSTVTDEYVYDKIDGFIEEFIKELTENSAYISKRKTYLIKRLRGSVFRCFSLIREHICASKFEPLGYEMRFDDDNIGCIEFELSEGRKAKITGVIDRSDVYHGEDGDYIRVIDYKTGSKVFSLNDVFYGLDIQLFVYLNALVGSKANYRYGGALYFKVDDPIFKADNKYDEDKTDKEIASELRMKGLLLSEEALLDATDPSTVSGAKKTTYNNFVALDKHLRRVIKNLCEDMSKGRIDMRPYSKKSFSPCQWCAYKSVCGFDVSKKGNNYEYIDTLKDNEIWETIGGDGNVD